MDSTHLLSEQLDVSQCVHELTRVASVLVNAEDTVLFLKDEDSNDLCKMSSSARSLQYSIV